MESSSTIASTSFIPPSAVSSTVLNDYDLEVLQQTIGNELFGSSSSKHVRTTENYHIILPATPSMGAILLGSIQAAVDPVVLSQNLVRLIVQCSDGHKGSITKERRKFALEMETSASTTGTNPSTNNHSLSTLSDTPPTLSIQHSPAHVLELAFEDFDHIDLLPYLQRSLPLIQYYRVRGYTVFINCAAGRSRSTSILLAYLMIHERMNFIDALRLVREKRPVVCPNLGFVIQLMRLERSLYAHYRRKEKDSTSTSIPTDTATTTDPATVSSTIPNSSSLSSSSLPNNDTNPFPYLRSSALKQHPHFHFVYDNADQGIQDINEKLSEFYTIKDIEAMTGILDTYNHHDQIMHNQGDGSSSMDALTILRNPEELGQELFHLHVPLGGSVLNMSSNHHISTLVNADVVIPADPDTKVGGLLIASYLGASDPQILAQHKVRLVVQCAIEHKGRIDNTIVSKALQLEVQANLKNTDMNTFSIGNEPVKPCEVLEIGFQDYDTVDILTAIAGGIAIMNRTRNHHKTVLVNCAAGISRSASTVLAHLMVYEKLSLIESIRKLRKARPVVLPNIGFLVQLMRLERSLNTYRKNKRNTANTDGVTNNVDLAVTKPELPEGCLRSHMMYNFAFDNDNDAKLYLEEKLSIPVPVSLIEEMIQYTQP